MIYIGIILVGLGLVCSHWAKNVKLSWRTYAVVMWISTVGVGFGIGMMIGKILVLILRGYAQ